MDVIKESKQEDKLVKQFSRSRSSVFNKTIMVNNPYYVTSTSLKMVGRWAEEQEDNWNDDDIAAWSASEEQYDDTTKRGGMVFESLKQTSVLVDSEVIVKEKSNLVSSNAGIEQNNVIRPNLQNIQAGLH